MPVRVVYDLQPSLADVLDYLSVVIPSIELAPDPDEPRGFIQVTGEDEHQLQVYRRYYPISETDWIIRSPDYTEFGTWEDVMDDLISILPFHVAIRTTMNSDPVVIWDVQQGSVIG